jgi:hypothetical protein
MDFINDLCIIGRKTNGQMPFHLNGSQVESSDKTYVQSPNQSIFVGAENDDGQDKENTISEQSCFVVGKYEGFNQGNYNIHLRTLLTTLGVI